MRVQTLKRLITLVEESMISELEIRRWGTTIRISKHGGSTTAQVNPAQSPVSENIQVVADSKAQEFVPITSPMVGTFYRASAPDVPPYVQVGDLVKPGQVLCIIEAMKLMNEIESEVSGEVVKILVGNEEPVEYGQELFLVRPV